MTARGNQGHVPDAPALKNKPAEREGRRRRAGGATSRQSRSPMCQNVLTFLTRPSLTRRIASQPVSTAFVSKGPPSIQVASTEAGAAVVDIDELEKSDDGGGRFVQRT